MEKSELQDMDLVYTRDKALFWVLYSKWYNELCLFNYNLDCIRRMSEYNTDLTHKDDMRNDIVGVIRVNSWYNIYSSDLLTYHVHYRCVYSVSF